MPTLSLFAFERQSFQQAGPFHQAHGQMNGGQGLFWEGMWDVAQAHAVFAYVRADTEIAQSLSAVVNNQSVLDFVDGKFKGASPNQVVRDPERKGPIRTSYMTWGDVDKTHVADPGAHQDWELITTISIDFHCNTDWYLPAMNGTIVIYVYYFLDADGKAQVRIEGWSDPVWDETPLPDYGLAGKVSDAMAKTLAENQPLIQSLLENALRSFAGDRAYSEIYILPGTGATVGVPFADNADQNVSLCLVPRLPTGQSSHGWGPIRFRLPEGLTTNRPAGLASVPRS